jgi:hypothetical protein
MIMTVTVTVSQKLVITASFMHCKSLLVTKLSMTTTMIVHTPRKDRKCLFAMPEKQRKFAGILQFSLLLFMCVYQCLDTLSIRVKLLGTLFVRGHLAVLVLVIDNGALVLDVLAVVCAYASL